MVAAAVVAATVGASLTLALPAWAPVAFQVQGTGVCNAATGEYDVLWTLTNQNSESATIDLAQMTPPNISLVAQFPNPIAANGGQASATGTVPGATTSVLLAVDYTLGSGPGYADGEVVLPGTCAVAPGPSSLQVGPSQAAPGEAVTISGAGCAATAVITSLNASTPGGTVTGSVAFDPPLAFGPLTAAPDGTWSASIVVPPGTPPGSYAVSATCTFPIDFESVSALAAGFDYPTTYLTVVEPASTVASAVVAAPRQTG
jgi:hypothetical protein